MIFKKKYFLKQELWDVFWFVFMFYFVSVMKALIS